MRSNSFKKCVILIATALLGVIPVPNSIAMPKEAHIHAVAPYNRLLHNLKVQINKTPRDAQFHLLKARVHALVYACEYAENPHIETDNQDPLKQLPLFAPGQFDVRGGRTIIANGDKLRHLLDSIEEYHTAIRLGMRTPIAYLGLGWISEQAEQHRGEIQQLMSHGPIRKRLPHYWEDAKIAYKMAFKLSADEEVEQDWTRGIRTTIGMEAGAGFIRITSRFIRSDQDLRLADEIKTFIDIRTVKSAGISPIVIPLGPHKEAEWLTAPGKWVGFDLFVDNQQRRSTWVRSDVGILVWDPLHTGKVSDGQQLFGNRTWQMFWKDGYEPLAALDNNRDGWLTGNELIGIAVWLDRNGNGVADPGEVQSLSQLGITAIAVKPKGTRGGLLSNSDGVTLKNGRTLPTFDWIAEARPTANRVL